MSETIFDVGFHRGEDTAYYLAKGFRVVGFEADPFLVDLAKTRFRDAIDAGRLTLVEGAISDRQDDITFYANPTSRQFGTTNPEWGERNEAQGKRHMAVTVKTVSFRDQLSKFGVPYYMKVDIEGADQLCLKALLAFDERPKYLSVESNKTDFTEIERECSLLGELGYDRFMAVQQRFIPGARVVTKAFDGTVINYVFETGASGPFGDDLDGPWMTQREVLARYEQIFRQYRKWGDKTAWKTNPLLKKCLDAWEVVSRKPYPGWYDTHAC